MVAMYIQKKGLPMAPSIWAMSIAIAINDRRRNQRCTINANAVPRSNRPKKPYRIVNSMMPFPETSSLKPTADRTVLEAVSPSPNTSSLVLLLSRK